MPKAQCWWCDTPTTNTIPKHGMIYLHKECFYEITDMNGNLEEIKKYMEGYRPAHSKDYPTIEAYIREMKDFQRRWKNTEALIKKLSVVTESKKEGETSGSLASPESKRGRSCVNDLAAEAPDSMNCVEKDGGNK